MTEVIAGLFYPILVMLVAIMVSERLLAAFLMAVGWIKEWIRE